MKFFSRFINIFNLIIFCLLINIEISSPIFTFPTAITLVNGNIIIVEKLGIYIYSPTFSYIRTEYTFPEEDQIKTKDDFSRVVIKRSKGYVLALINYKFYFFSGVGQLIYGPSLKFYNEELKYYSLIPCAYNADYYIYYFIIGFFNSNNQLNLMLASYNIYYGEYNIIDTISDNIFKYIIITSYGEEFEYTNNFISKALSCEYMKDITYITTKILACFFVVKDNENSNQYLVMGFYSLTTSSISNLYYYEFNSKLVENVAFIKSDLNCNFEASLVCYVQENKQTYCYKFYIYKYHGYLSDVGTYFPIECRNEIYGMKATYLFENDDVIFSCDGFNGNIYVAIYSQYLNNIRGTYAKFNKCQTIYGHSILYLEDDYYILSDVICYSNSYSFTKLIGEDNILEPLEEEEEEEEEKEEKEGEEEKNEEFLEIKETQMKMVEKCKIEKCSECNKESTSKNLCLSCNIQNGYYPLNRNKNKKELIREKNNEYIDCVNQNTKPKNFYFEQENQDYEECYESCATCDNKGDGNNNNCTSCEDNYIKKPEFENSKNCVFKCLHYYYYNSYSQYK